VLFANQTNTELFKVNISTNKDKIFMENTPNWADTERLVVEPIANGILVTVSTDSEEFSYSFKSYRQVLRFLKLVGREPAE